MFRKLFKLLNSLGYMAMFGTLFYILGVISAVWVIYNVWTKNKKDTDQMKIVWTVLAIIFSIITAIFYYFLRKK